MKKTMYEWWQRALKAEGLLKHATRFQIGECTVERRSNKQDLWCVLNYAGDVLNNAGEWEHEQLPSHRTAAFKLRTRFTLEDAIALAAEVSGGE